MDNMSYRDYAAKSKQKGETNDCSVIATAAVTGIDYDAAHDLLRLSGRKPRKGLNQSIYLTAIRNIGYIVERIELQSKTVRTVERELAENWGHCKVMVRVPHHVLAWNGHKIVDWTAGRTRRIQEAWLIYKGHRPKPSPVPIPEQRPMKKTARPTTAVMSRLVNGKEQQHKSLAAAYRDLGLDLKGHQQIRQHVKHYGEWTEWCWRKRYSDLHAESWTWERVLVTFTKIEKE
jgi:hypothetical protein